MIRRWWRERKDREEGKKEAAQEERPIGTDPEALKSTLRDTRSTIDYQLQVIDDIDNKAAYLIRLNILILGLLLTVLSILWRLSTSSNSIRIAEFDNLSLWIGAVFSGISLVTSIWAYTRSKVRPGLSAEDADLVLSQDFDEQTLLTELLKAHKEWIEFNREKVKRDAHIFFASQASLFLSIGFYALTLTWGLIFDNISRSRILLANIIVGLVLYTVLLLPTSETARSWYKRFCDFHDWLF